MLRKYIIERNIPGIGGHALGAYGDISRQSNHVLELQGPRIQWLESFVARDKIYCVYLADNDDLIREHARISGLPADRIEAVRTIIDPSLASA